MKRKFFYVFISLVMLFTCMTTPTDALTTYYPTDVTTTTADTVLVGAPGRFVGGQNEALALINSYRYEACKQGLVNPANKDKKLTEKDYVPLKWSEDLERIARIRAAEASYTMGHVRADGDGALRVSSGGLKASSELLAWNSATDMIHGVKQWYAEKSDYVNRTGGVTGHYESLIDPRNTYIGLGMFISDVSSCPNTTSCEMSGYTGALSSKMLSAGAGIQIIEMNQSKLKSTATVTAKNVGNQLELFMSLEAEEGRRTCKGFVAVDPVWQKVSGVSGTLSKDGIFTPAACGTVTFKATFNGITAENSFDVHAKMSSSVTKQPTCASYGVRTYKCGTCNKIIKTENIAKIAHSYNIYNKCSVCGALKEGVYSSVASVKIRSVSKKKTSFTVKWKKNSKLSGYEIRYSTFSSMNNAKKVKVSGYKKTSKTVKKLKRKTKYYIQIRGYKTSGGKTKYSVWSAVKTVKTK